MARKRSAVDDKGRELLAKSTPDVQALTIGGAEERDVLAKGNRDEINASNVIIGIDETERAFALAGAIEPPYNPATLTALFEHSNSLRPNIDAYATNIDGHGHRFEAVIDLDGTDADDRVSYAIITERERLKRDIPVGTEGRGEILLMPARPTAEEVATKKVLIRDQMRMEKTKITFFFEYCCADVSFSALRRKTRQDFEVMGNGYWEVLRNGIGEIAQFTYIPGFTMRLLPLDRDPIDIQLKVQVSDLDYDTVKIKKRFRKYIQVFETQVVYFKELGDPRVISRRTGRVFETIEQLQAVDPSDDAASEIIHFKLHNPRSAYGVPRWTGQLLSVLGSRQAEEINYLYFENKSVPPLALLVSGGRVTQQTVDRLKDHIENEIKGKKNFHKMMIVEAMPDGGALAGTGQCRIVLQPLTSAQQNDGLFQKYDQNNIDKVGNAFRMPRLLRGDIKDFNRATADAALEFAEQQVFAPEREDFDFLINRKVLSELGTKFWKFRSNAPTTRDPEQLAKIITMLGEVLTPDEAREFAEGVFNKDLKKLEDQGWTKQPLKLTLAQIAAGGSAPAAVPDDPDFEDEILQGDSATNKDADAGPAAPAGPGALSGTVGTTSLAGAGALVPAQGPKPAPPASRLRAHPHVNSLMTQAKALLKVRKALELAEMEEAMNAFTSGKLEAEIIKVPQSVFDTFIVKDDAVEKASPHVVEEHTPAGVVEHHFDSKKEAHAAGMKMRGAGKTVYSFPADSPHRTAAQSPEKLAPAAAAAETTSEESSDGAGGGEQERDEGGRFA